MMLCATLLKHTQRSGQAGDRHRSPRPSPWKQPPTGRSQVSSALHTAVGAGTDV